MAKYYLLELPKNFPRILRYGGFIWEKVSG
jgi:hypothetical protein